jgi:hypothetical protein
MSKLLMGINIFIEEIAINSVDKSRSNIAFPFRKI